jgi:DNA polymerase
MTLSGFSMTIIGMDFAMNDNEIIKEIKKACEFYKELGFEYLPIKTVKSSELRVTSKTPNSELNSSLVSRPSSLDKETALKALKNEIGDCQRCMLSKGRKNIVFGEGNSEAKLMFVGEGPGREEDLQARPFVGDAGKLLTRLIEKMGLKREEVYIANIVKCRPPSNREPEEDEIATCSPFLERQIEIIKPKVIIALGKISAQHLTESKIPISKLRGNFYTYKGIPVMPTFHPAYLLRNPKDKWLTWEDMQKVLEKLS